MGIKIINQKNISRIIMDEPKTYNSLSFKNLTDLIKVIKKLDKDNNTVSTLNEGQFFGEASFIHEAETTNSVKAQNYCDLYKLSKDDFLGIIKRHPELKTSFKRSMKRRASDRK